MGLTAAFGTGAGTVSYEDFHHTAFMLLVGANVAEAHPIIFHHIMKGVKNGAEMVVVDPRKTLTTQKAHEHMQIAVGSDIALANAMAHVIIRDGLYHKEFVAKATTGFEDYALSVKAWTPERAYAITGISAKRIESLAHRYAKAPTAIIGWTLGITEHHNAVDNVLALINLSLLCGNVGRPGVRTQSFSRSKQRAGRRRHGGFAQQIARVSRCLGSECAREIFPGMGCADCGTTGLGSNQNV